MAENEKEVIKVDLSVEELQKMKKERMTQREKMDAIYHQLTGQIALIDELIEKAQKKEEVKK